jgi:putative endopeptidase
MDRTVKPGDSFFGYANGNWDRNTPIPADKSSWGGFGVLRDLSDQRTRAILEEAARSNAAAGTPAHKVGALYATFMDEAAIERAGRRALEALFRQDRCNQHPRPTGARLWHGEPHGNIDADRRRRPPGPQGQYAIRRLHEPGRARPSRPRYYLDDANPKFVAARAAYQTHVANMLRLAGITDPAGRAQRIYELEKKIAQAHWTRAQSRQVKSATTRCRRRGWARRWPGSTGTRT